MKIRHKPHTPDENAAFASWMRSIGAEDREPPLETGELPQTLGRCWSELHRLTRELDEARCRAERYYRAYRGGWRYAALVSIIATLALAWGLTR